MLRNYLTVAFRSLRRDKANSLINVFGLSLGILCCVLIALFVNDEWTFDRFHTKVDRIYRAWVKEDWGEKQLFINTVTPFPLGPALKDNFPEVESMVRVNTLGAQVRQGSVVYPETITVGGQDFFKVFDFPWIAGDRTSVLQEQGFVVLSETYAAKYFGTENPIDKPISIQLGEKFEEFTVKGVARVPVNSSISFTLLISDLNYPRLYSERALTSAWFNVNPETYVLLKEGVNHVALMEKFPPLFKTLLGEEDYKNSKYLVGLQPMKSIHLDTSLPVGNAPVNDPKYSYILAAIAGLILFVACINYVTLAIGRSLHRAREVGIRKVVGAQRRQLITQFISEAVLVTVVSIAIGLSAARLLMPAFNDLAAKQLELPVNGFLVAVVASLLIVIGIITGSYPAFVLSSFRPITILKGATPKTRQGFRKVLVGLQLVLSIFLISSTLTMRQQLDYLQSKNLGYNKSQLAVVRTSGPRANLSDRLRNGMAQAEQFKAELIQQPEIESICASSHDFGTGNWIALGYTDDTGVYRDFNLNVIDDEYIPAMEMEMVAGRNFSDANPSDARRSVIVNEALVKEYGWADAIGKRLPGKNFQDHEIVGVVKDFNFASLYTSITPLVMVEDADIIRAGTENINIDASPVPKLLIRIKAGQTADGIAKVEAAWKKINGTEEFAFSFVDEALNRQYRSDQNLGRIVNLATILAMVIGSLGLYALASLAMQSRVKEISIRKVMGATEGSLLGLLSRDYVVLVLVSLLLSVPLTVIAMRDWLSTFEYRINLGWTVFLMAGGISMTVALITISWQTLKTAASQPAETLKYE